MKKILRQHVNRKPLLALAMILFGVSIAIYTNASAVEVQGISEGFDTIKYPQMDKIYNKLKETQKNSTDPKKVKSNLQIVTNTFKDSTTLKKEKAFLNSDTNFMTLLEKFDKNGATDLDLSSIPDILSNIETKFE